MIPTPPTAATRLIALLGDPVEHSLSPVFQNAAIATLALDAVYLALRCGANDLPGLLRGLARAGGAGNVTVPHKQLAAEVIDQPTEAVARTGACNTFWSDEGEIWGDNTDVAGFGRAVESLLGQDAGGARVLLIGAGGAARAGLCSLIDAGADEVVVLNRSVPRAQALVSRFSGPATRIRIAPDLGSLGSATFDLAVNATSLGLNSDDPLPLDPDAQVMARAVLDLVYAPERTRWVREHLARGTPAADGLEMLLQQGAAAFERWWDFDAPLAVMRATLPSR